MIVQPFTSSPTFNVLSFINWLSVAAAFAAYFLLGAAWYLWLFPKAYRTSLGKENESDAGQSQQLLYIVGPTLCALIITITCAVLLSVLHISLYGAALGFALLVGVGYLFANTVDIAINPSIPRPFFYGLITGSYHLVGMVLVNLILAAAK